MRPLAATLWVLLAALGVSSCGGSSYGSPATSAPARTSAAQAALAPAATAPATYHTQLERAVAHAFESAVFLPPAVPTESQVPPKLNLLLREPPTVCRRLRPEVYRCSLTYQLRLSAHPLRLSYVVRTRRSCFTATAPAIAPKSTLHRLGNC